MRKPFKSILLALFFSLNGAVFAMGGQPQVNTLTPAKIVDDAGKVHTVVTLTCDDKTYFDFQDGTVTVKVPFEKIEKLVVKGASANGTLAVEVYFKNGKVKAFNISPDVECTGVNDYGTVDFQLSAIKEIEFLKVEKHKR